MKKIELSCIRCPRGCRITVETENGEVTEVSGNGCIRGETYARNEAKKGENEKK